MGKVKKLLATIFNKKMGDYEDYVGDAIRKD